MESKRIELEEGKYVVQVQAIKKDEDEPSAMAPYLSNNSIITKEADKVFMTLMIVNEQVITGLQIKNEADEHVERVNVHQDDEANTRYEIFEFTQFQTLYEARVQYEIEHEGENFKGDEPLRLAFDENSILNVEDIEF